MHHELTMTPTDLSESQSDTGVSIRADELAAMVDGQLVGNPDIILHTLAPIENGHKGALTFIRTQSFAKQWADSDCQAALVTEGIELEELDPQGRALIFVKDADVAVVKILGAIDPGTAAPCAGVHPKATVDPDAKIDPSASIGPGCVLCKNTIVGKDVVLVANVYIGQDAQVGDGSFIHPGVVLGDRCTVGKRCLLFANSVIGADGFGFLTATPDRPVTKVPQIGTVEIGDDVEIGACSTIDRAKFGVTRIGNRAKLDNQVHVAHNCIIGEDVLLCGRTTLGGSATIGDRTMVGGAVVLNDQAVVGKDVKIAGGAIVLDTIADNESVLGVPAMPARTAMANIAAQRNIAKFCRQVNKSLKKLDANYKPS
tara:strand:+ start:289747 stop:290856 length:1110 start_codon:yes stop_codon:yes gene_type:complete